MEEGQETLLPQSPGKDLLFQVEVTLFSFWRDLSADTK